MTIQEGWKAWLERYVTPGFEPVHEHARRYGVSYELAEWELEILDSDGDSTVLLEEGFDDR